MKKSVRLVCGSNSASKKQITVPVSVNGKKIDFTKIDEDLFMIATIKSVSGDIFMLKDIFKEHIKSL